MSVIHPIRPVPRPVLRRLLAEAYAHDPCREPIAPFGEDRYTTLAKLVPAALAVLHVAAQIEPEPEWVLDWYRRTRIAELGQLTAEQLVAMGRAPVVVAFLQSIRDGARG